MRRATLSETFFTDGVLLFYFFALLGLVVFSRRSKKRTFLAHCTRTVVLSSSKMTSTMKDPTGLVACEVDVRCIKTKALLVVVCDQDRRHPLVVTC